MTPKPSGFKKTSYNLYLLGFCGSWIQPGHWGCGEGLTLFRVDSKAGG